MSWLKNTPSLRASFNKRRISNSPPKDADPTACFESFRRHWQQAYEIIQRSQVSSACPSQDDVLGVVNHLDHMATLLIVELRAAGGGRTPGNILLESSDNSNNPNAESQPQRSSCPSLEYLLSDNLLDKLYSWSLLTGRYSNALVLEQLKLYELLVNHSRDQLLVHEPFLRPLLKLLTSSANEVYPLEVEKRLVILLNQLCISLMQNIQLLDLFFFAPPDQGPAKFVIFSLLIPFVHREEGIGQQARDALLLCMSLSRKNDHVGIYIAQHSNVCPVLATGLSGLYSLLPRKLHIENENWFRLTPDDVTELPELAAFMNSLEFCNAVVQVAHPLVKNQLLEFLYQGFLVPVMGPALLQWCVVNVELCGAVNITNAFRYLYMYLVDAFLQDSVGLSDEQLDTALDVSTIDELIAATAYLELSIRSVSEPGLLRSFVRFLLEDKFDEERILDNLVRRIKSKTKLSLVTLSLLDSLVSLHCEDVMLELVFRHLIPCSHVMLSQRRRVRDSDPYCRSAERFLSLVPSCFDSSAPSGPPSLPAGMSPSGCRTSLSCDAISTMSLPPTTSLYGLRHTESLYGNYHAYLCDARTKLQACAKSCSNWVYPYDGETPPCEAFNNEIHENGAENSTASKAEGKSKSPPRDESNAESVNARGNSEHGSRANSQKEGLVLPSSREEKLQQVQSNDFSLASVGESSGYESFAFKCSSDSTPDNESSDDTAQVTLDEGIVSTASSEFDADKNNSKNISSSPSKLKTSQQTAATAIFNHKYNTESSYTHIFKTTPTIGPFLDAILQKLEDMLTNELVVNLQLTGLISRLAIHPQPLLKSFLMDHSLVFQPSIRSLFQVLGSLKHRIDSVLAKLSNVDDLVAEAQEFLVSREDRLTNARRLALDAAAPPHDNNNQQPSSPFSEAFSRGDRKHRTFSSTFVSVFRRATQAAQPIREQLESAGEVGAYRYIHKLYASGQGSDETEHKIRNIVLCAVILDEWLKELAAISQEHSVFSLCSHFDKIVS